MKQICKILFGSHLYGLNTPNSDKDYKGVFIPSGKDIILQRVKGSISYSTGNNIEKNTKDDVDYEIYSLQKFLEMIATGQTAALEMLFAPKEFIVETSEEWEELRKIRYRLISQKADAFIGYCKTQANKYGIKGSRMATIKKVLEWCEKNKNLECNNLWQNWDSLKLHCEKLEFIHFMTCEKTNVAMIEICGRKFQNTISIHYMKESLEKIYNNYGERAKQAEKNEGIDWKALSHACRVCCQGLELYNKNDLTLPLPEEVRKLCMKIKKGEMAFKDVQTILEGLMSSLEKAKETTELKKEIDPAFIDTIIQLYYRRAIYEGEK